MVGSTKTASFCNAELECSSLLAPASEDVVCFLPEGGSSVSGGDLSSLAVVEADLSGLSGLGQVSAVPASGAALCDPHWPQSDLSFPEFRGFAGHRFCRGVLSNVLPFEDSFERISSPLAKAFDPGGVLFFWWRFVRLCCRVWSGQESELLSASFYLG